MEREFYLRLASAGLRMPIGTHLVLHEQPDPEAVVRDGERLGRVVAEAARRFRTPLAFPLMDLKLEKEALLLARDVPPAQVETFHFAEVPAGEAAFALTPKMRAACEAIRYVATETDLVPVGTAIGPFSLMTKLVADPIAPVFLAGTGATAEEEPEVALVERLLELSCQTIQAYLEAQITAGAKAVILCEPAANTVYFSPNQLAESYAVFDRYVMEFNRRIREQLRSREVDLIFHDCGELADEMVRRFAGLDPAILSLGSSRRLWEDAALVPRTTVLYGNLPTKQFYSDERVTVARVRELSRELIRRMREADYPFILGSECDVLSVPGAEPAIRAKVAAFLEAEEAA
ncbi:MAG: uroporphyrinogen decarboxylase family protein [Limisphaerales bacterium]